MRGQNNSERLRVALYAELGLDPSDCGINDWTEREWATINRAVDLVASKMSVRLQVGMHAKHLFPADALLASGIVSPDEMAAGITSGCYDGQLCSLPLSQL